MKWQLPVDNVIELYANEEVRSICAVECVGVTDENNFKRNQFVFPHEIDTTVRKSSFHFWSKQVVTVMYAIK